MYDYIRLHKIKQVFFKRLYPSLHPRCEFGNSESADSKSHRN